MALINTTTTGVLGSTFFGDGTGPLTVQQNGVTLGTYGNIPTFSAYLSTNQSVTSGAYTKIQMNVEEFDTNNNYDPTTNYRFTPTIAGYYQINAAVAPNGTSPTSAVAALYKNGSVYKYGPYIQATNPNSNLACIVYMNGTTDYVEIYAYQTASVATWGNGATSTYFQGFLVKAA
jgi:hypothetical protein